jgi:hypothetical protein
MINKLDMEVHTCNYSTEEAEAGKIEVWGSLP